eukprot:TRINITY_DN23865_c0_g1_i1.p1 TRINITY_DN23865_c0_g1~~TRINITY_DN23865_c0_g1_i1.p1  ORF type:complete len:105 (+),score=26.53 TRINITY_DN23865_c0_g1_i1:26-316(+)
MERGCSEGVLLRSSRSNRLVKHKTGKEKSKKLSRGSGKKRQIKLDDVDSGNLAASPNVYADTDFMISVSKKEGQPPALLGYGTNYSSAVFDEKSDD